MLPALAPPLALLCALSFAPSGRAASGETHPEVLVVVNGASEISRRIGDYYRRARGIPAENVCAIDIRVPDPSLASTLLETIQRSAFERHVREPVERCLVERGLRDRIEVIVTTKGVPYHVVDPPVAPRFLLRDARNASVEAELALLFSEQVGSAGVARTPNPYFGSAAPFATWKGRGKPLRYLTARLDAYPSPLDPEAGIPADLRALVDRAQAGGSAPGAFVVDEDPELGVGLDAGNRLLLAPAAAALRALGLPVLEEASAAPARDVDGVAGLATWGSNASRAAREPGPPFFGELRGSRYPGRFAPRAITVPLVSSDARSFVFPPRYGQSLLADLLRAGVAGAAGHVREPLLAGVARPYLLLREYALGAKAVEAYYRSLPWLGWTNVYVGDPLMTMARPVANRPADQDGDGVPDSSDTCRDLPNPEQRDDDGDGIGNLCDADVDGDGWVSTSFGNPYHPGDVEKIALDARAFRYTPAHDLDGDGKVNERDVSLAELFVFQRPGPGRR